MATLGNDRLAAVIARHPDRYAGLATIAPQDPKRAVQGDGTRDQDAQARRCHDQLAHQRRVPRREQVLADPRSRGRARCADLHPPALPIARDGAAVSQVSPGARHLGLRGRDRPARRAPHRERGVRRLPEPQDRDRTHGREHSVRALPHGLDACARGGGDGSPQAQAHAERVLQAQLHDHHERRQLARTTQVLHRGARRRQHHVGGRLPVPGDARGRALHERGADFRRRQSQDLPSQRRASVPHTQRGAAVRICI